MTLNPLKLEYKQIKEDLFKQTEEFLLNGLILFRNLKKK
ncbi:hypothetical protein LCGC14_1743330 [marine sediment metagenome]|uniref:Uncharacterized protein n=1 Tax=marine sediment metagenome TaxID=412755 RepID=A0A0F9K5N1_9ZZZZ